jgi:hypothetical protein
MEADFRIVSGKPTVDEARAIEKAFAKLAAEQRAHSANQGSGTDAWTLSGRLAAHGAANGLASIRTS